MRLTPAVTACVRRAQLVEQADRDLAAAQLDRALKHAQTSDRHDPRDDRHVAALCRDPVPEPEVVLGVEEHLGDGEVGARPALLHEMLGIGLLVGRARVPLWERGDADGEVARGLEQLDELPRVGEALRMGNPGRIWVAGRVAAQREDVAHANVGVAADDVAQLRDRVVDRGEVGHRVQLGLLGNRAGHLDGALARGPACPVRYGDERRLELLDATHGAPELPLTLVGLRREELERERPARLEHVGDARRVLPGATGLVGRERRLRLSRSRRHVSKHNPGIKFLC
jgi:hypothetical protein